MGNYLDMVNNDKPSNGVIPNENCPGNSSAVQYRAEPVEPGRYAALDGSGNPSTYGQDEIIGFAYVSGMDVSHWGGRDRQIPQSGVLWCESTSTTITTAPIRNCC